MAERKCTLFYRLPKDEEGEYVVGGIALAYSQIELTEAEIKSYTKGMRVPQAKDEEGNPIKNTFVWDEPSAGRFNYIILQNIEYDENEEGEKVPVGYTNCGYYHFSYDMAFADYGVITFRFVITDNVTEIVADLDIYNYYKEHYSNWEILEHANILEVSNIQFPWSGKYVFGSNYSHLQVYKDARCPTATMMKGALPLGVQDPSVYFNGDRGYSVLSTEFTVDLGNVKLNMLNVTYLDELYVNKYNMELWNVRVGGEITRGIFLYYKSDNYLHIIGTGSNLERWAIKMSLPKFNKDSSFRVFYYKDQFVLYFNNTIYLITPGEYNSEVKEVKGHFIADRIADNPTVEVYDTNVIVPEYFDLVGVYYKYADENGDLPSKPLKDLMGNSYGFRENFRLDELGMFDNSSSGDIPKAKLLLEALEISTSESKRTSYEFTDIGIETHDSEKPEYNRLYKFNVFDKKSKSMSFIGVGSRNSYADGIVVTTEEATYYINNVDYYLPLPEELDTIDEDKLDAIYYQPLDGLYVLSHVKTIGNTLDIEIFKENADLIIDDNFRCEKLIDPRIDTYIKVTEFPDINSVGITWDAYYCKLRSGTTYEVKQAKQIRYTSTGVEKYWQDCDDKSVQFKGLNLIKIPRYPSYEIRAFRGYVFNFYHDYIIIQ